MRTQINTTQKRNKKKQSIKIDKDPMQSKHNPKKKNKSEQKYKANENTSRHNPKKKQKETINKNR
jgi:hypothetical protein